MSRPRLLAAPLLVVLAAAFPARAQGLRYRIQVWMRGDAAPQETRFTLLPTPAGRSHNRVQKPRFGGWHLEADRGQGTPYAQVGLLARAERLMFLAGPSPETKAEPISLRFAHRSLPIWRLEVPKALDASAVLVEVGPGVLALCDLSAKFPKGDLARVELHLEDAAFEGHAAPPADGTALLSTLQQWVRDQAEAAKETGELQ